MALSANEAIFVRGMILYGNKLAAVREAYPRLEKGFEQAAIKYLMQNPEVPRHIDAGILYMYRSMIPGTSIPGPAPLTMADKMQMLRLIIEGERETPTYIVTKQGLRLIFTEPPEQDVEDAKAMLKELQLAEQMEWVF